MRTKTKKGIEISAISLGTVQLGLDYGINNTGGKPDREKAFAILDCAVQNGINTLDTAAAYGNSEEIIGQWLASRNFEKKPFIATKVHSLDYTSLDTLRSSLRQQVEESKKRLGLEQLPLLMLHHFDEYLRDPENMFKVMEELKASGDVCMTGASAYSFHDYKQLAETGFDAVQIPLNIFDWTQIENGGLKALEDSGMIVFARSIYLQGLVFKKPEDLEPHMDFCREPLEKFRYLCEKYNLTPAQLSLSYALSLSEITSLVLGSETVAQVQQNVELAESAVQLSNEQLHEIRSCFLNIDGRVLNPSAWVKK